MEHPSGSAFYHQSGGTSFKPKFHILFPFSFLFPLPKISASPKAEEKLLICITPCPKSPSPIPELSCSSATFLTKELLFRPCPSSAGQRAGCCPEPLWNWARDGPTPPQWSSVPQVWPSAAWGGKNKSLRRGLLIYRAFKHFKGQKRSFSKSSNCPKMSPKSVPAPWPCCGLMLSQLIQGNPALRAKEGAKGIPGIPLCCCSQVGNHLPEELEMIHTGNAHPQTRLHSFQGFWAWKLCRIHCSHRATPQLFPPLQSPQVMNTLVPAPQNKKQLYSEIAENSMKSIFSSMTPWKEDLQINLCSHDEHNWIKKAAFPPECWQVIPKSEWERDWLHELVTLPQTTPDQLLGCRAQLFNVPRKWK